MVDCTAQGFPRIFSAQLVASSAVAYSALLTALVFATRLATYSYLGPLEFWFPSRFVVFMPAYFGQYVACFVLGVVVYHHRALQRFPTGGAYIVLAGAMIWWCELGFVVQCAGGKKLYDQWGTQPVSWIVVLYMLYHTFVEQSFGVVWSIGLIILFKKETGNTSTAWPVSHGNAASCIAAAPAAAQPASGEHKLVRAVTGAAYSAFVIHTLFIAVYGSAFRHFAWPTTAVNAAAVFLPVLVSSWLAAMALKQVPGCNHVL